MSKDIAAELLALLPVGAGMALPPPIFSEMGAEFVAFKPGVRLVVRFPNKPQYMNPLGYMQGGDDHRRHR